MALTDVDTLVAGFQIPVMFSKYQFSAGANITYSTFFQGGIPGPATVPTVGLSGEALTTYPGQLRFANPPPGKTTYLARLASAFYMGSYTSTTNSITFLKDRLWHNSGINVSSTSVQTVNSVAFPPRDTNGTSNGHGVLLGLEVTTNITGSSAPTITVEYTNSDGVARTIAAGTAAVTTLNAPTVSTPVFMPLELYGNDLGVRSVQNVQFSSGYSAGAVSLVAYRVIVAVLGGYYRQLQDVNPLTGGLPVMHNNTVPFITFRASTNSDYAITGMMIVTQG